MTDKATLIEYRMREAEETFEDAEKMMATGVDWIMLGRAAIIHHDFPLQMQANPAFKPLENPVSKAHLEAEGVSEKFLNYLSTWKGFVATDEQ